MVLNSPAPPSAGAERNKRQIKKSEAISFKILITQHHVVKQSRTGTAGEFGEEASCKGKLHFGKWSDNGHRICQQMKEWRKQERRRDDAARWGSQPSQICRTKSSLGRQLTESALQGWILKRLSANAKKVITKRGIRHNCKETLTKLHHWKREPHENGQRYGLFKETQIQKTFFFLLWCIKLRLWQGAETEVGHKEQRERKELQLKI